MRRGALLVVLFIGALLLPAQAVLAASTVELKHASDGTLVIVGEGWRAGPLVVSLGQDRFTAYVDSAGDFEVRTGLTLAQGPIAVHHAQPSDMAMLALDVAPSPPSPLAIALIEGLADGVRSVAAIGAVAFVLLVAIRRRYPRH